MSSLDDIIATLRRIGAKDFGDKIAKEASNNIFAAVSKTLAAGTSPDGTPWAPRKEGGRAYANAASKLSSASYGNLVRLTITGPEVYGHYGAGVPVRQMIPDAGAAIPPTVEAAIEKAAVKVMWEAVR